MSAARLRKAIARLAEGTGVTHTAWPGLAVGRIEEPRPRAPVVYSPSLCVVAQGRKFAYLGDEPFEYNARSYLLCSLPLPIESEIVRASPKTPLLAAILRFDPAQLGKLLVEMEADMNWPSAGAGRPAVAPCEMTPRVHEALVRFVEAVADPLERRVLGSGLERELLFEVLRGPNGDLLRNYVLRDSSSHRVARVVAYLEQHYREPLEVAAIAKHAGMSSSSLHEHFKRATSLSPMQFVKKMRLHEARAQLLRGQGASEAAFAVGYTSASQFSREFRRMFGHAPSEIRA